MCNRCSLDKKNNHSQTGKCFIFTFSATGPENQSFNVASRDSSCNVGPCSPGRSQGAAGTRGLPTLAHLRPVWSARDKPILPREVSAPGRGGSAPAPQGVSTSPPTLHPTVISPRGRSGDDPLLRAESCLPGLPCSSPRPSRLWTTLNPAGTVSVLTRTGPSCRKAGELESARHAFAGDPVSRGGGWGFRAKWGRIKTHSSSIRKVSSQQGGQAPPSSRLPGATSAAGAALLGHSCGGWWGLPLPKQSPGPATREPGPHSALG